MHGGERVERSLHLRGDNLGECGLANAWRSPQDERGDVSRLNHLAEYASFSDEVFLSDIFIERLRSQAFC